MEKNGGRQVENKNKNSSQFHALHIIKVVLKVTFILGFSRHERCSLVLSIHTGLHPGVPVPVPQVTIYRDHAKYNFHELSRTWEQKLESMLGPIWILGPKV